MRIVVLVLLVLLCSAFKVTATCDCWMTEQIDEWTDARSIVLVCANAEQQIGLAIFVPDAAHPRLEFYDPNIKAQPNTLVGWQYRIGNSEPNNLFFYWNTTLQIPGYDHISDILTGIQNNEKIIFRFNPFMAENQSWGQTHAIGRCKNGRKLVRDILPLVREARLRMDVPDPTNG